MQDFFRGLASLLAFLPLFYGACAVVQLTVIRPKTRYVVIGSFGTLAVLIALTGLLSLTVPDVLPRQSGILLLVVAGVTLLPMFKRVRLLLGRITPIDPNSTVDISGVIVAFWILVIFGTVLFTIDLNALAGQVQITVADSLISVLAYPALALSLVGVWITRGWRESISRLGLERLTAREVGISLALVVPLLIAAVGIDQIGRLVQPERYAQLESILESMSSGVTNPAVALILGFSAGIGEEILFRGAIQPRLGIGFTALLFAVAHSQYGFSFATVGILLIGIVLGYQRKWMNTTSCIITHGAYNTVVFLLSYFAGIGSGS
jgi:membrane protease YdiL (CAAX protease family)